MRSAEVVVGTQRPVQTGRGHLEAVSPWDRVLDVEQIGQLTSDPRAQNEVDSILVMHQQTNAVRVTARYFDIYQFGPVVTDDGAGKVRDDCAQPIGIDVTHGSLPST